MIAESDEFYVRTIDQGDVEAAARVCLVEFNNFNASVGLPPEWPSLDVTRFVLGLGLGPLCGLVAIRKADGAVVGSNVVDERDQVAGVGPISSAQPGAGRLLMLAALEVSRHDRVRLFQVAANARSFSLYLSLGFDPVMSHGFFIGTYQGPPLEDADGSVCVPLSAVHVDQCDALYGRLEGLSRRDEIAMAAAARHPGNPACVVLDASGRVVAYSTGAVHEGHTLAASDAAFKRIVVFLSAAIEAHRAAGALLPSALFVVPHDRPGILRWIASSGFRLDRQVVHMVKGPYTAPDRSLIYTPSITY